MSRPAPEALHVNRPDLLDQNARRDPTDLHLGTKRRGASTARSRRNDHDRPSEELVGLHDNAEAVAVLIVAYTLGNAEPIDVTPAHGETP